MKVRGTAGPVAPPELEAEAPVRPSAGSVRTGEVASASEPTGAAATGSVMPAADPIAKVAASLRAGTLTAEQAALRLVELVTGGPTVAAMPASLRDQVRRALEGLLETDPYLRERLRRLG